MGECSFLEICIMPLVRHRTRTIGGSAVNYTRYFIFSFGDKLLVKSKIFPLVRDLPRGTGEIVDLLLQDRELQRRAEELEGEIALRREREIASAKRAGMIIGFEPRPGEALRELIRSAMWECFADYELDFDIHWRLHDPRYHDQDRKSTRLNSSH